MHAKRTYYKYVFNTYSTNLEKTWQTIAKSAEKNKIFHNNLNWHMVI